MELGVLPVVCNKGVVAAVAAAPRERGGGGRWGTQLYMVMVGWVWW